ncbi:hypothetical protein PACTADRAFT_50844 [Pachysolen tannophilus NRRL Y-2460]|uniref:Uncharacterized protein n=1 Tax=Pachysolen tannophilus NRRL Y-2460 TaxID=669874 RepID=A0A1E4TTG4_PACTA|nr:hypothetical protein PACTADRAFT_50844 [Pachysolen tannophilus NRRL Y-2460]
MNASKLDIQLSNIYQCCSDEIRKDVMLDYAGNRNGDNPSSKRIKLSNVKSLDHRYKTPVGILNRGTPIPPDEILSEIYMNSTKKLLKMNNSDKNGQISIPIVDRYHLKDNKSPLKKQLLPSFESLNTLHYYFVHRINNDLKLSEKNLHKIEKSFDETALLALGILIEEWIQELVEEEGYKIYMEQEQ